MIKFFTTLIIVSSLLAMLCGGCAQIGSISGGVKDTLAPKLLNSSPMLMATNISTNKITLNFDEYIDLQDVQNNIIVSPYPKINPTINFKLKTITIKLKDSLLANTTYAINFGNAIKDVNEGNVFKNFTYTFSTGNVIDSLTLSGKILLAENDKVDSTIIVMLYKNAVDSTVQKLKPNYIANVNGQGKFNFTNLPAGVFNIYALKDGDGSKTYNSKTELFAFLNKQITIKENTDSVLLYAFAEEKIEKLNTTQTTKIKPTAQKKLKYTCKSISEKQDLINNLTIEFNNKIKLIDTTKIVLTDSNYKPIGPINYLIDSNKLIIKNKWIEGFDYRILIYKNAVTDFFDSTINKTDTLKFKTKNESDYGNVILRFNNLDFNKYPILIFTQEDNIKATFPILKKEWQNKLFSPGEYEIRILYDENNNGKWDTGNYLKKLQPEKVIALPKKFTVKENWDNESEINL